MEDVPRVLYLLHFAPPFRQAGHYLGITREDTVARRLDDHRRGKGASLTRKALEAGSTLTLVRLWHGASHQMERRVKWAGHFNRLCPLCLHRLPTAECSAYPPLVARVVPTPATRLTEWP